MTVQEPDERTAETHAAASVTTELIDIRVVASLLACSTRHVRRLADAGRRPPPIRLGNRLLRWRRDTLMEWIGEGCPDRRKAGRRR